MRSKFLLSTLLVLLASTAAAAEKPRVFVTESPTFSASGKDRDASLSVSGGMSPQSVEVMKQLQQRCPGVIVTADPDKADFTIRLDHEPPNPTTLFVHGNKLAVFSKNQDLIFGDSTRLLRTAVDKACAAITGRAK